LVSLRFVISAPLGASVEKEVPNIMKNENTALLCASSEVLKCPACGNQDRFIEVMHTESHIVDGRRNYISLLEGVADHYICFECGKSFEEDFC